MVVLDEALLELAEVLEILELLGLALVLRPGGPIELVDLVP